MVVFHSKILASYIDDNNDTLYLLSDHSIKCFGGLSVNSTTINCSQPIFDSDAIVGNISATNDQNKMLGIYSKEQSSGWLKNEVGVLFGYNGEIPNMVVDINEEPWGCAGSHDNEYCYVGGSIWHFKDHQCNDDRPGENGCNVVTSFMFTYTGGVNRITGMLQYNSILCPAIISKLVFV